MLARYVFGNCYWRAVWCKRLSYVFENFTVRLWIIKVSLLCIRNQALIKEALQERALILFGIEVPSPVLESCQETHDLLPLDHFINLEPQLLLVFFSQFIQIVLCIWLYQTRIYFVILHPLQQHGLLGLLTLCRGQLQEVPEEVLQNNQKL